MRLRQTALVHLDKTQTGGQLSDSLCLKLKNYSITTLKHLSLVAVSECRQLLYQLPLKGYHDEVDDFESPVWFM